VDPISCNQVIEHTLRAANNEIAKHFDSDVVFLKAPMRPPIDSLVKNEIEEIKAKSKKKKLTVLVETPGGYIETVERIVSVFRKHYDIVEYVVPNYAYSAGTVLVLSGDELYMDYYSVLGPIDPQINAEEGNHSLPGMGYLAKFEELTAKINAAKKADDAKAELAYLIKRFDPGRLFIIEQAIEHSKSLLREWLPKYKFKSWTVKETSKAAVTDADREQRAEEIARILGDAKHWHSHGRGVGIKELTNIKLKVVDYGQDQALSANISHYHGLLTDYMGKNRYGSALHSIRGVRSLT
jgi:hypothetical protein